MLLDIEVLVADYSNAVHANDIIELLDSYTRDPMGGGNPLSQHARENLIAELAKLPNAFSVLCYVDGAAAGLVNCFIGFSTFQCKPLINIHDVVVGQRFRGQGLSRRLLSEVQRIAIEQNCCRLTLEVLDCNEPAKKAYLSFGFQAAAAEGKYLFWKKAI